MDTPIAWWPCSASRAAATEESTPPDIATTIRILLTILTLCAGPHPRAPAAARSSARRVCLSRLSAKCRVLSCFLGEPAQFLHQAGNDGDDSVYLFVGRIQPEAEAKRILRAVRGEAHRLQHVRRLERA